MANGLTPPHPEDGRWRVTFRDAFMKWHSLDRPLIEVSRVHEWLSTVEAHGPPEDAVSVGSVDDFYVAAIPGTTVTARFLVIEWEYRVIVKDFL